MRKPKREKAVEIIVNTQEYELTSSVDERYKKYFLFWRSWHEELLNLLDAPDGSRKGRVFAAKKIIENLEQMQKLLLPQTQRSFESFILEQKLLLRQLDKYNLNPSQKSRIRHSLEKQRRQIQKKFNYRCVREHLIEG